mgnify:CR=1 FL=1
MAGVVTPRNDGPVQVVFDAAATELSEKGCSIVYPSGMDKGNKVLFTDKADKPTIAFDLPAYRYVGENQVALKHSVLDVHRAPHQNRVPVCPGEVAGIVDALEYITQWELAP